MDISTPLHSGWAEEYHVLPGAWAESPSQWIYPPPFIVGGPRNIMHIHSAWAEPASYEIYPPPFIVDGPRNIMHLPSAWAESPSQWIYPPPFIMGQGISCVLRAVPGVIRAQGRVGSGRVGFGVRTDMASASGSLCRLVFLVQYFSHGQRARREVRQREWQRGGKLRVQSGQCFTAMIFDN